MKKKIAILGSTGSVGKTLLNIIREDKKNFEVVLLTANKNYNELLKQAKIFKVKNLIINNKVSYKKIQNLNKTKNIKIFNNFKSYNKIFRKKVDYTMCSITGIDGLEPTINIIKHTKTVAIANKESIICGWNLIYNLIKKYKTKFIPVDSEHFSLWYALKNKNVANINSVFLTASGGPLLNISNQKIKKIKIKNVLKHPNWKMGKKISIDSATMMNKVFEVIEAKNIFDLTLNKVKILIHPNSYIHAILSFKDGMVKIIAHETTMKIPIFNSIYTQKKINYKNLNINIKKMNNLDLRNVDYKKFPLVKILKLIPDKISLFETVVVSANDELVRLYLSKKINFNDIEKMLFNLIKKKEFIKLKNKKPNNISDIIKLDKYVRLKLKSKSV